jgi:hypothetical protein
MGVPANVPLWRRVDWTFRRRESEGGRERKKSKCDEVDVSLSIFVRRRDPVVGVCEERSRGRRSGGAREEGSTLAGVTTSV